MRKLFSAVLALTALWVLMLPTYAEESEMDTYQVQVVVRGITDNEDAAEWTGEGTYKKSAETTTDASLSFRPKEGYRFIAVTDKADGLQDLFVTPVNAYPQWTQYAIEDIDRDHTIYLDVLPEEVSWNPSIELDKTAYTDVIPVGASVMYKFEITNSGDVPLRDIILEDPLIPDIEVGAIPDLKPGQSFILYRYAQMTTAGDIVNKATVQGYPYVKEEGISYEGPVPVTDTDEDTITVLAYGIDVEVAVSDSSYETGERVTLTYTVRNTGESSYGSVRFTDSALEITDRELVPLLETADGSFDPGDSLVFTEERSYSSEGPKSGTAYVWAYLIVHEGQEQNPVAEDEDTYTVMIDNPASSSGRRTREYTLTLDIEGEGSLNITQDKSYSESYEEGALVDISYSTAPGWVFDGFSSDSDVDKIRDNDRVLIEEDTYLKLIFVEETEAPEDIPETTVPEGEPDEADQNPDLSEAETTTADEVPVLEDTIVDGAIPQTGGLPFEGFSLIALGLIITGVLLRRRNI